MQQSIEQCGRERLVNCKSTGPLREGQIGWVQCELIVESDNSSAVLGKVARQGRLSRLARTADDLAGCYLPDGINIPEARTEYLYRVDMRPSPVILVFPG